LIFEKLIEIAKYYDWESIFRGSLKRLVSVMVEYTNKQQEGGF